MSTFKNYVKNLDSGIKGNKNGENTTLESQIKRSINIIQVPPKAKIKTKTRGKNSFVLSLWSKKHTFYSFYFFKLFKVCFMAWNVACLGECSI